ncbi:MAG: HD domain-containing protein [Erysipelotrichaceae bacterium]|nr:HD domain-containing protein [Erysipelotrichaceae bacterium]
MKIEDLKDGTKVDLICLVSNVTKGVSNNNSQYLNVTLQDSTGTIEAKKWDATEDDINLFKIRNIVHILGESNMYRNNLQLKIISAEAIEDYNASDFVMSAPVEVKTLENELHEYLNMIKDKDVKAIVEELINKNYGDYLKHPAATRNHHEYCSGLLYHSISVTKLVVTLAEIYKDLDKDILIGGALIHDLGKIKELSGPIIPTYTTEGKLIGHISIMQAEIKEAADKLNIKGEVPMLLEHMILSHHGKKEFGSPVLPMTREALVLSIADDLDAKMNILEKAYKDTNEGEFTNRIYPLEDRAFYKPKKR